MKGFGVTSRMPGHWDIGYDGLRAFRIRGALGNYHVIDDRKLEERKGNLGFKTVAACMAYITDILMYEAIKPEPSPHPNTSMEAAAGEMYMALELIRGWTQSDEHSWDTLDLDNKISEVMDKARGYK